MKIELYITFGFGYVGVNIPLEFENIKCVEYTDTPVVSPDTGEKHQYRSTEAPSTETPSATNLAAERT